MFYSQGTTICSSGSTRIGGTKIQENNWMAESKSVVGGKVGGKTCMYANLTLQLPVRGNSGILSVVINGVHVMKCNLIE